MRTEDAAVLESAPVFGNDTHTTCSRLDHTGHSALAIQLQLSNAENQVTASGVTMNIDERTGGVLCATTEYDNVASPDAQTSLPSVSVMRRVTGAAAHPVDAASRCSR